MNQDDSNKHLWDEFCKLGEMIGDGLHLEKDGKWISKEYKRLSEFLIPEIKEVETKRKIQRNINRNQQIEKLLEDFKCNCGSKCTQTRSGSLTVKCNSCGKRYKAQKKRS